MDSRFGNQKWRYMVGAVVLFMLLAAYKLTYREGEAMPGDKNIQQVQEEDFDRVVLKADKPVLVDFYGDSCPPCRMLAPILDEFARENPDTKVVKVDVGKNPGLASRFNISGIPLLLVFKNGELTAQHKGLVGKEDLKAMMSQ